MEASSDGSEDELGWDGGMGRADWSDSDGDDSDDPDGWGRWWKSSTREAGCQVSRHT